MQMVLVRDYHMLIEETSQPGNIKLTGMVQDAQQNKLVVHPYNKSGRINCLNTLLM